jgi:UDP-N-acetylmuramoylalanine--D-glutamate ligase
MTSAASPTPNGGWPCPARGWSGSRALVIGAGQSGMAMAQWLAHQGATVRVIDSRESAAEAAPEGVELLLGVATPFSEEHLRGCDLVALSPGLTPHAQRGSPLGCILQAASEAHIPVAGELDLFDWAVSHLATGAKDSQDERSLALQGARILAVTGTNGKTTTARLVAHLLRSVGVDVQEAGNQGPSLLRGYLQRAAAGRWPDVWVVELSSFQLALASRFGCTAATVLNLSQDHQDWHLGMDDYRQAKLRVFGLPLPSAVAVVDRDDAALAAAVSAHLATGLAATSEKAAGSARRTRVTSAPRIIGFGLGEPQDPGPSFGLVYQGIDWLAYQASDASAGVQRLMPAGALKIQGRHNLRNAMAALGLCLTVCDDLAGMLHGLRRYTGEPHRMQWVTEVEGVAFINDSKATNVGATIAALEGTEGPLVVIVGGQGKGQDFSGLVRALRSRGASVVGIGEQGPAIVADCQAEGLEAVACSDLPSAVSQAWQWSQQYPTVSTRRPMVLLSPACASFDMFANYADRGDQFAQLAHARAQMEGQLC